MKNSVYKLVLIPFLAVLVSLVSCSKKNEPKDKDAFYITTGSSPADTKVFVNGNPTNRGHAISLFLIEGDNLIDYKGDFEEGGYSMRIVKTKNLFSNDFEVAIDEEKSKEEARKSSTGTFKIDKWWRWTWQDCDMISEVTDNDKKEILAIFDTICNEASEFENNKNFLTSNTNIIPWSEHPFFSKRNEEFMQKAFKNIQLRKELTESKASHEEIEFLVGKQIIMLMPTKSPRLYDLSAARKNDKKDADGITWNYSLGFNEMFFVKKDGKWKMLLPVN